MQPSFERVSLEGLTGLDLAKALGRHLVFVDEVGWSPEARQLTLANQRHVVETLRQDPTQIRFVYRGIRMALDSGGESIYRALRDKFGGKRKRPVPVNLATRTVFHYAIAVDVIPQKHAIRYASGTGFQNCPPGDLAQCPVIVLRNLLTIDGKLDPWLATLCDEVAKRPPP